ncbi:MAG: adenylyl-sulfate kinase [Melioribacteraceae bacterium]|nr:adenylyl-sulfate kinase [Melioribacteraceae bacterium]
MGDESVALSVGGIEVFLKMLVYFFHERAWDRIKFGKKQITPAVIWLTGLAKSGKKEIAFELEKLLKNRGFKTEFIDGHSVRGLIHDYGFEKHEVNSHVERVGVFAKRMEDQGIFVIASFLSPYQESRKTVREICNNFHEVFVNTPVDVCEKRDDTGVYAKAKKW